MKPETRKAREERKYNETVAQLLGMTVEEVQQLRGDEDQEDKAREVQAVHLFLENPDAFTEKTCQECQGLFMTNYRFASLCSTRCRIMSLERVGITWNPQHTPANRWARTQIPTEYSIPPAALKVLLLLAQDQEAYKVSHNTELDVSYPTPLTEPSESFPNTEQSNNDAPESLTQELLYAALEIDEDYLL